MSKEAVGGPQISQALPQKHLKVSPVPGAELDSGALRIYVDSFHGSFCR